MELPRDCLVIAPGGLAMSEEGVARGCYGSKCGGAAMGLARSCVGSGTCLLWECGGAAMGLTRDCDGIDT